jgi:hypothetical protein
MQISVPFSDKNARDSIAGVKPFIIGIPLNTSRIDFLPIASTRPDVLLANVAILASMPIIFLDTTFSNIAYLKASRELMPNRET